MNFTEINDDDLTNLSKKLVSEHQEVLAEVRRREEAKRQDHVDAVKNTPEFKKLVEKFRHAQEHAVKAAGEQKVVLHLPIEFTLNCEFTRLNPYHQDTFDRFVTAKILKNEGSFNRVGKELLQTGLDSVIENACDDIFKLFPEECKSQNEVLKELAKLHTEMTKLSIPFSYILQALEQ